MDRELQLAICKVLWHLNFEANRKGIRPTGDDFEQAFQIVEQFIDRAEHPELFAAAR